MVETVPDSHSWGARGAKQSLEYTKLMKGPHRHKSRSGRVVEAVRCCHRHQGANGLYANSVMEDPTPTIYNESQARWQNLSLLAREVTNGLVSPVCRKTLKHSVNRHRWPSSEPFMVVPVDRRQGAKTKSVPIPSTLRDGKTMHALVTFA